MLIAGTIVCAAGLAGVLWSEGRPGWAWPGGIAKMTASTAFLFVAWRAGAFQTPWGVAIFVGLALSWWGDLFLIFRAKPVFLAGLVSFFAAHVAYIAAFAGYGMDTRDVAGAGVVVAALALHVVVWLHPHLDEMRAPVYAYMAVISVMVAFSVGAWTHGKVAAVNPEFTGDVPWLFPLGAGLFYVSDVFVARDRFVAPGSINRYIGLPLYYGGQVLLAWGAGVSA